MTFKVGDIVKYTAKFLQSVGWYTGVPIDGKVLKLDTLGKQWQICLVQWCDYNDGDAMWVRSCNLLPKGQPDYTGM